MKTCFSVVAALMFTAMSFVTVADEIETLVQTCGACHGAKGISSNPAWPNLAGQNQAYLAIQIRAFRDGTRQDPVMSTTVAGMSDKVIDALARYYSELKPPMKKNSGAINQAGRHVSARCISCHGMRGRTVNSQWPNLSGQKKDYLQKQLKAFRDGSRYSAVMKVIVKDFTDQQIADVAEYYSRHQP